MPKHEYFHSNYFCHIREAILNAILNFFNLLNGDKMPSTGSINVNKIATKLFGFKILNFLRHRFQILHFSLVLTAIFDASFTEYIFLDSF